MLPHREGSVHHRRHRVPPGSDRFAYEHGRPPRIPSSRKRPKPKQSRFDGRGIFNRPRSRISDPGRSRRAFRKTSERTYRRCSDHRGFRISVTGRMWRRVAVGVQLTLKENSAERTIRGGRSIPGMPSCLRGTRKRGKRFRNVTFRKVALSKNGPKSSFSQSEIARVRLCAISVVMSSRPWRKGRNPSYSISPKASTSGAMPASEAPPNRRTIRAYRSSLTAYGSGTKPASKLEPSSTGTDRRVL